MKTVSVLKKAITIAALSAFSLSMVAVFTPASAYCNYYGCYHYHAKKYYYNNGY